ncbi:MAG: nicotinate-nucleotide adenylyltransferase [Proteobacteria bacterium]|nr:nicotinate-nucleotide adenylyltransferase [Pseudomonadota bacterium]HQR05150.1 nicotinate-nucleotide adenylyltransferase [Rhodocyclaceae bacterium]
MPEVGGPVGILGGTFDPIHHGHLRLAQEARDHLQLNGVRLIPSGQPPHRGVPGATPAHRLAMTRLACADNPAFVVDDAEILATGPSYTVTTLERLRALYGPQRPLVLLLGADAFLGLEAWHRWETVFDLAHVAVATRPSHRLAPEHMTPALAGCCRSRTHHDPALLRQAPAGTVLPFAITALDVSATAIRTALQTGGNPRYLLPGAVLDYIAQHRLYSAT